MTVAAGLESRFSSAAVPSQVSVVRWGKSFRGASARRRLLATCFQRAGSGIVAASHLKKGNLFFSPFSDLGLQLDKAVLKGCKKAEQLLPTEDKALWEGCK